MKPDIRVRAWAVDFDSPGIRFDTKIVAIRAAQFVHGTKGWIEDERGADYLIAMAPQGPATHGLRSIDLVYLWVEKSAFDRYFERT